MPERPHAICATPIAKRDRNNGLPRSSGFDRAAPANQLCDHRQMKTQGRWFPESLSERIAARRKPLRR